MLKFCSISYKLVKDFIKVLRERSKRNEISENEYEFSYKYFNKYSLTTEIIQPKFDHILFFEFSEKEDNEVIIFVGPIFNDKIGYDLNLKSLYDDVLAKIKELNKPDILEICKICCIKIFLEITRENTNENLKKELNEKNFEGLLSYFVTDWKNEEDTKNKDKKEEISKSLTNVMNLAKIFDEIIKENRNNEEGEINFDDVKIFQRKNNARLNIEELFTEKINPSFKFNMIKNIKVVEELINTALKEDDVSNLFKGKIKLCSFMGIFD